MTNSTLWENSADSRGGAIHSSSSGPATVTNSIVFLNADANGVEIWGPLTAESGFNLIGVDPQVVEKIDGLWENLGIDSNVGSND